MKCDRDGACLGQDKLRQVNDWVLLSWWKGTSRRLLFASDKNSLVVTPRTRSCSLAAAASHTKCSPKFPQRPAMHISTLSDVIRPNGIGDGISRR